MLTLLTITLLTVFGQFELPIKYEAALAGNFGEPRPHHFHAGIDLKTDGTEGKPLFAMADGYIYAASVGLGGYGNALYIRHTNGYTSMYCHLKSFNPWVAAMVTRWQYEHQSPTGMIIFEPSAFPVVKGDFVAVSGNTGASQAPHLHLEVHNTATGEVCDPMAFLGRHIVDGLPPMAHAFKVYPQKGMGMFNGSEEEQTFGFTSHRLSRTFTAWGKVGFGLWANDYMEITYNKYGVYRTQLLVDGRQVFDSQLSKLPVNAHPLVAVWGDYQHFLRSHVWYMKSFLPEEAQFPWVRTSGQNGIVEFNEERPYRITYVLTDYKGNQSRYEFSVTGRRFPFERSKPLANLSPLRTLNFRRNNVVQLPGFSCFIPQGSLVENVTLEPTLTKTQGGLSQKVRLLPYSYRLLKPAKFSVELSKPIRDASKLYIKAESYTTKAIKVKFQGKLLTFESNDLGYMYSVAYDDHPPMIIPYIVDGSEVLRFGLVDNESGIESYAAYMDGKYLLLEAVPKSQWVACKLNDCPYVKQHKKRKITLVVNDKCKNKSIFTTYINY